MGWKPQGRNHRQQNFQSNFEPLTRQNTTKTPRGGNHEVETMEDSISSLISSHKPGKTPQRYHGLDTTGWKPQGGNHGRQHFQSNFEPLTRQDTTGWKPRHHDTMRDSISSLISRHKPGKTPRGGNHDTTRDSISSLISRHKLGKTPRVETTTP